MSRLRNQPAVLAVWPTLTVIECEELIDENAAGYESFVSGLDDNDFSAVVRYRNSQGDEFANTVIDILTQVVVHGAYHRGQIAKALDAPELLRSAPITSRSRDPLNPSARKSRVESK